MIAASSALMLAGVPFDGPVSGIRVGRVNGEFKAFLTVDERKLSDIDIVVAGIKDGVTMVEAGANEVSEDLVAEAIEWGFKNYQSAIDLQNELVKKVAPAQLEYELIKPNEELQTQVNKWVDGKLGDAIRKPYPERNELISTLRWAFHEEMARWRANGQFTFEEPVPEVAASAELKENEYSIDSPIAGSVWQWLVKEGEHIDAGHVVALVESMKMEIEIRASRGGVVTRLLVHEGSTVSAAQPLLIIAVSEEESA